MHIIATKLLRITIASEYKDCQESPVHALPRQAVNTLQAAGNTQVGKSKVGETKVCGNDTRLYG